MYNTSMKRIDLTGQTFGAWTVKAWGGLRESRQSVWLCRCECGTERELQSQSLREGKTHSCGCLKPATIAASKTTHGQTRARGKRPSRTYEIWQAMHARCKGHNEETKRYYFDRGITVCKRWSDFANFLEDMGEAPDGMSIDRIVNNKGYYASNCRWADAVTQANNRRERSSYPPRVNGVWAKT